MLTAPANDVPATEEDREAEAKWDGARAVAYGSGGGRSSLRTRPRCRG